MDDYTNLFLNMLNSQLDYVLPRIFGEQNQNIYLHAHEQIVDAALDWRDFTKVRSFIVQRFGQLTVEHQSEWDFFGRKKKYTNLAIEHARDILNSIDTRFISGGSKSYDIW